MSSRYERRVGPPDVGQAFGLMFQSFAQNLEAARQKAQSRNQELFLMDLAGKIGETQTQEDALSAGFKGISAAKKMGVKNVSQMMPLIFNIAQLKPSKAKMDLDAAKLQSEAASESESLASMELSKKKLYDVDVDNARDIVETGLKNIDLFPPSMIASNAKTAGIELPEGFGTPEDILQRRTIKQANAIFGDVDKYDDASIEWAGQVLGIPKLAAYRKAVNDPRFDMDRTTVTTADGLTTSYRAASDLLTESAKALAAARKAKLSALMGQDKKDADADIAFYQSEVDKWTRAMGGAVPISDGGNNGPEYPPAPKDPKDRVKGKVYTATTGKLVKWDGVGWLPQQ